MESNFIPLYKGAGLFYINKKYIVTVYLEKDNYKTFNPDYYIRMSNGETFIVKYDENKETYEMIEKMILNGQYANI